MINRSIPEAYITIINIYASNTGVHQYITQMVPTTIVEIESNTIKEGNFTNSMHRSSRQKINKETQVLTTTNKKKKKIKKKKNDTLDQLDLIDLYRTVHPKTVCFTFFSKVHMRHCLWSHQGFILHHIKPWQIFLKNKNISIISNHIFSYHSVIRLDIK